MPAHPQRTKKKKNYLRSFSLATLIVFSILAGGILLLVWSQFKTIIETPSSEVKKIPRGFKKIIPASPSATLRVPILIYHYVEYVKDDKDTIRKSLNINPNTFAEQVKTLSSAGYTFMTASELADVFDGLKPLPPKPVLLTFDDGHWDLYTDVLPILKEYQVKATAYIVTGFIGGSDFLSSEQLKEIIQSGLIEIGAHTVHHVSLKAKLSPVVKYEVEQSKKTLEDTYQLKVVSFAYPGGNFDEKAIEEVKAAGYRTAASTILGTKQSQTNRFFLERIRTGARTGKELLKFLEREVSH